MGRPMNEARTKKSPLQVWVMVASVALVLIAGFLVFPGNEQQRQRLLNMLGTSNHGILLTPVVPFAGLAAKTAAGATWSWLQPQPDWRLVIVGGAQCVDGCREMLYVTRQVHILLGNKSQRLQRLYLNLDTVLDSATAQYLSEEHRYLETLYADREEFQQLLASTNADWQAGAVRAFLVDPHGVAMMFYTAEHDGGGMLEDIKHLFKYSPEP